MKDENATSGNNPVFSKCLHHGFFHSIFLHKNTFHGYTAVLSNWMATLSCGPTGANLLIRTAPSGCHTVSEPGPNLMLPLLSHSTPSTTSCRCGLLRSRHQDGIRCENDTLLEMPVWKENGERGRRGLGKQSTVMVVWPPWTGEREVRRKRKQPRLAVAYKVWQSYQQWGNCVSQEQHLRWYPLHLTTRNSGRCGLDEKQWWTSKPNTKGPQSMNLPCAGKSVRYTGWTHWLLFLKGILVSQLKNLPNFLCCEE